MQLRPMPKFDAPVPGENFTSDTQNYAWHRQSKNQDFVSSVEHMLGKLAEPEKSAMALTALETGETILNFVAGTLRLSVANGNLTIDNAILAAGPYARAVEQLAKEAGVSYEKGWSDQPELMTPEKVRMTAARQADNKPDAAVVETGENGFASVPSGPASADEQAAMLGHTEVV